jgi:hypothetical protein
MDVYTARTERRRIFTSKSIHEETTVKRQEEGKDNYVNSLLEKGWDEWVGKGKTNQTERACLNMPQYQNDLSHVCGIRRLFGKASSGIE